MADWRQIQARIRKAKNSPDAQTKLSDLYARTHDAMVAWELGVIGEKAAQNDVAVKWYTISAERFRRPEWKKKAEEALSRLGAPLPVTPVADAQIKPNVEENTESFHIPPQVTLKAPLAVGEIPESAESETDAEEEAQPAEPATVHPNATPISNGNGRKRRRGRRGGRGRRRQGPVAMPSLPNQAFAESIESQTPKRSSPAIAGSESSQGADESEASTDRSSAVAPIEEPQDSETRRSVSVRSGQGRAGDPGLSSRMARLESMLRRLVSGTPHRLDQADEAPAGPGVLLLSDSDQATSYYIESCQTLRVALANLLRGGRGKNVRSGGRNFPDSGLKEKLAQHLGINEAKVAQYMKEHCVVRWVQTDEDAQYLAHFAIGVLRTPLNLD